MRPPAPGHPPLRLGAQADSHCCWRLCQGLAGLGQRAVPSRPKVLVFQQEVPGGAAGTVQLVGFWPPTPLMPTPAEPQVFIHLTSFLSRLRLNKGSMAKSLNITELIHHFDFVDEETDSKQLRVRVGKDFPGGPVAKTLRSQCRGPGFNPWSGGYIPHVTTKDPSCLN